MGGLNLGTVESYVSHPLPKLRKGVCAQLWRTFLPPQGHLASPSRMVLVPFGKLCRQTEFN